MEHYHPVRNDFDHRHRHNGRVTSPPQQLSQTVTRALVVASQMQSPHERMIVMMDENEFRCHRLCLAADAADASPPAA